MHSKTPSKPTIQIKRHIRNFLNISPNFSTCTWILSHFPKLLELFVNFFIPQTFPCLPKFHQASQNFHASMNIYISLHFFIPPQTFLGLLKIFKTSQDFSTPPQNFPHIAKLLHASPNSFTHPKTFMLPWTFTPSTNFFTPTQIFPHVSKFFQTSQNFSTPLQTFLHILQCFHFTKLIHPSTKKLHNHKLFYTSSNILKHPQTFSHSTNLFTPIHNPFYTTTNFPPDFSLALPSPPPTRNNRHDTAFIPDYPIAYRRKLAPTRLLLAHRMMRFPCHLWQSPCTSHLSPTFAAQKTETETLSQSRAPSRAPTILRSRSRSRDDDAVLVVAPDSPQLTTLKTRFLPHRLPCKFPCLFWKQQLLTRCLLLLANLRPPSAARFAIALSEWEPFYFLVQ